MRVKLASTIFNITLKLILCIISIYFLTNSKSATSYTTTHINIIIISRSIMNHYQTILNYFDNRSTNSSAKSFNAKIKAFRSQFRAVRNIEFFLFRLTNIYA
ncbi:MULTISPECIES: transposase [unclassified Flavobacterium]|uniref:transposase n=2 Tax=Flavobacterium TaxID=237 RepID=UPI002100FCAB|nr:MULTISPECIES: transposase [unclassified Flavobacterium]